MRAVAWDPAGEVKEDSGGMFVGGNRFAEGNVPKMLERVGKRIVGRVACGPEAVPLGEFFRSESGEAEKIIGAVLDHVDAEVVPGEDAEVGAVRVAEREALELDQTI